MRKLFLFAFFIVFCFQLQAHCQRSGIVYRLSGGRFGDNLLAVAHGKWVSYRLGIPLVYTAFPYSDQLMLSVDPSTIHREHFTCSQVYPIDRGSDFLRLTQAQSAYLKEPMMIVLPFYPDPEEAEGIRTFDPVELMFSGLYIQVGWNDPHFLRELRSLISPRNPVPQMQLPTDRVTVAIHIRTGAGGDEPSWGQFTSNWPLKGAPFSYYVDALKALYEEVNQPLYAFIFTDSPNPFELQQAFERHFSDFDIVFDSRAKGNEHDKNVIEDFFAMKQFHCLVRGKSNYGYIASKIFPYDVVVSPLTYGYNAQNQVVIDRLVVQVNRGNESRTKIYQPSH